MVFDKQKQHSFIKKHSPEHMTSSEFESDPQRKSKAAKVDAPVLYLLITLFKVFLVFAILYVFLVSIGLMGAGFKIFGKDLAKALIETTSNPFVGLFIGILSTALIQSSSTTTSMIVAFVAAGTLTVNNAVPIIMGANVGTAVTATLVSLGHVNRQREFRQAFAAATVHDMFNLMCVVLFLPLELLTGFLSKSATALTSFFAGSSGAEFKSPLKLITKPVINAISQAIVTLDFSILVTGIIVVLIGVGLLFASLYFLSKLLRFLVVSKFQKVFQLALESNGYLAILIGLVLTTIVQSSSVTTSLLIPMAAAGIIGIKHVFPVALGANVGTTVTALLASLATGQPEALTIALVHLLFNISGIVVFYPIPTMRKIPIFAATRLAEKATKNRFFAVLFIFVVFFVIPAAAIFLF